MADARARPEPPLPLPPGAVVKLSQCIYTKRRIGPSSCSRPSLHEFCFEVIVVGWTVPEFCQAVMLAIGLAVLATSPTTAVERDMPAERRGDPAAQSLTFDIPAQALVSALETYGATSGFQVVYDAGLAKDRQSTDLKGVFTPEVALRQLLAETGLTPRFMAADGFVLVPDAMSSAAVNTASQRAVVSYYGHLQAGLRQAFCSDPLARSGGYRVALGLWIGSSGEVTRSALLDTTGDRELDAALDGATRGLQIGEPLPAGFTQPVVMIVTPDVMHDCQAQQRGQR